MELNEARNYIKAHTREMLNKILEPAKKPGQWICPKCSHGKGGDGLTFNPKSSGGQGLKCFGCGYSGDVIDMLQDFFFGGRDTKRFRPAIERGASILGITVDPPMPTGAKAMPTKPAAPAPAQVQAKTIPTPAAHSAAADEGQAAPIREEMKAAAAGMTSSLPAPSQASPGQAAPGQVQAGYAAYYAECRQRLAESPQAIEYLSSRGISLETALNYWIGYDPAADPARAPGALAADTVYKFHPTPRLICPTSINHYVARSIDPTCDKRFQKMNPTGAGNVGIFNLGALYQKPETIFVTEGFFNALSFLEVGACAIATNSAANRNTLIEALKDARLDTTLILAFDNDKAGREATEAVKVELRRLNIPFLVADEDVIGRGDRCLDGSKEDANDLLVKDRTAFAAAVAKLQLRIAPKPDNGVSYLETMFAADIAARKEIIPTGYPTLDELSGGGLHAGLYVIGAISSLGKTTFTAQLADQAAESGHDVLFFSLEMSQLEMRAKSLSRLTWLLNQADAVPASTISKGTMPDIVFQAIDAYKERIGDRVSVIEGNFRCDISFIGDYVRNYIRKNRGGSGERPTVVIDYLQILQPSQDNPWQTTKQTVDASVTELKRLSRELGIPVIVVSSINRTNYTRAIDFESFKESGGIEYTADVVWGMQLACLNEDVFTKKDNITAQRQRIKAAKEEAPRKIELVCLKNRFGKTGDSCFFDYYAAYDYFRDTAAGPIIQEVAW